MSRLFEKTAQSAATRRSELVFVSVIVTAPAVTAPDAPGDGIRTLLILQKQPNGQLQRTIDRTKASPVVLQKQERW